MQKPVKIIGIHFGDNDFGNTIRAFLRNLMWEGLDSFRNQSKKDFADLYNKSCEGLYWLCQNKGNHQHRDTSTTKNYLAITEQNVFLNEEVAEFIKTNKTGFNSDFHVLDTQVFEPYIYTC